MATIPDDQLFQYADNAKDKVVVITGAANGIGKEAALCFANYGAKVVIGDIDATSAKDVVREIEQKGGQATCKECNVTVFDEQVALFDLAMSTYGSVDIVIANAGIGSAERFTSVKLKDGKPQKPNMTIIDVNLHGAIYTTYLSQHYLRINRGAGDLKALVLTGSMASWIALPQAELYTASKHAVLGLMRSLHVTFALEDIRIACIHPFFADTQIIPPAMKLLLAGIGFAPIARIVGAMFHSATNPDSETSGSVWLIPDSGQVFMVPKEELKSGVYEIFDRRARAVLQLTHGVRYYARVTSDVARILGRPFLVLALGIITARYGWDNRHLLTSLKF